MKQLALLLASYFLIAPASWAADLAAFESFLGKWAGSGQLWGKPATINLEWRRTLAERFVSLDFDVHEALSGKLLFAGHAMYPTGQGTWHDTNGAVYSISWKAEKDAIVAEWGLPDSLQGKSVYRLRAPDEVEITDSVRNKDGSWREFARYVARHRI